jgi:hypothetical protein
MEDIAQRINHCLEDGLPTCSTCVLILVECRQVVPRETRKTIDIPGESRDELWVEPTQSVIRQLSKVLGNIRRVDHPILGHEKLVVQHNDG